jgi:phage portal protein BeeE
MISFAEESFRRRAAIADTHRKMAEQSMTHTSELPSIAGAFAGKGQQTPMMSYGNTEGERYQYFRHWVYVCVDAISSAVAGLDWCASEITEAEANPDRRFHGRHEKVPKRILSKVPSNQELVPLVTHPALDLVESPNEHQGKDEFIYFSVANLELTGACYWILGVDDDGKTERLFAVPSSWMSYNKKTHEYICKPSGMTDGIPIGYEYVAKTHFPNPADPMGCYSPLNACISAVRVDDYIQKSQQQAFDRGIHPNLIVSVGKPPGAQTRPTLTGAQRRQYVRAIREVWSQTVNIGDPAILDGMIDSVHKLQSTPQEMDWHKSGEIVKERIMQTYRVNPYVVGQVTGVNKAQAIVAQNVFNTQVVNPIAGAMSLQMTQLLGPKYEKPQRLLVYLEKATVNDRDQKLREWSTLRRSDDVTQDEIRAAVLNLGPLEDRDDPSKLLALVGGLSGITTLLQSVGNGMVTADQARELMIRVLRMSEEDASAIIGKGEILLSVETAPMMLPQGNGEERSFKSHLKSLQNNYRAGHIKRFDAAEGELGQSLADFFRRYYEDVDRSHRGRRVGAECKRCGTSSQDGDGSSQ